jgi:glycosyltransferase involved in cell wall biosynthesis
VDLSIIVTAYNYERYIAECLSSCLEQENHTLNYEIIVIDDGSTDATSEIITNNFGSKVNLYAIQNGGIERASNFGFEVAKGRYITRLDADDTLMPNYLKCAEKALTDLRADVYYFDYQCIDSVSRLMREIRLPDFDVDEVYARGDFLASGTLYSASAIKKVGGYDTKYKNTGLENFDLVIRLLNNEFTFLHIPQTTFRYRRHGSNMSSIQREKIIANGHLLALRLGLKKFSTNKFHPYELRLDG